MLNDFIYPVLQALSYPWFYKVAESDGKGCRNWRIWRNWRFCRLYCKHIIHCTGTTVHSTTFSTYPATRRSDEEKLRPMAIFWRVSVSYGCKYPLDKI